MTSFRFALILFVLSLAVATVTSCHVEIAQTAHCDSPSSDAPPPPCNHS